MMIRQIRYQLASMFFVVALPFSSNAMQPKLEKKVSVPTLDLSKIRTCNSDKPKTTADPKTIANSCQALSKKLDPMMSAIKKEDAATLRTLLVQKTFTRADKVKALNYAVSIGESWAVSMLLHTTGFFEKEIYKNIRYLCDENSLTTKDRVMLYYFMLFLDSAR